MTYYIKQDKEIISTFQSQIRQKIKNLVTEKCTKEKGSFILCLGLQGRKQTAFIVLPGGQGSEMHLDMHQLYEQKHRTGFVD